MADAEEKVHMCATAQLTLQYRVKVPKGGTVANLKEQVSLITEIKKEVVRETRASSWVHVYTYM